MKLSVIILSKNAEELITDCLKSVSFANQIIIVDNLSTDNTVSIAKSFGAKVIITDEESFAQRRNIGLSHAKEDWLLYVDTDERISEELQESIKAAMNSENIAAYKISRKNFYLGNHPWPQIEKLERLFYKKKLKGWHGQLHESPLIEGESGQLQGFLLHYTHRDLQSMLAKTIEWSKIEAQLRMEAHHPSMVWWRFPRVMMSAFYEYYIHQGGWKVGTVGIIESIYQAFSMFITYARLWELQKKHK